MSAKDKALPEITDTGDTPFCPTDYSPCVAVRGGSGPRIGTYVVVRCVTCKTEYRVVRKTVIERNERP